LSVYPASREFSNQRSVKYIVIGPIVDAEIRYLRGIGSQRLQDLVTPKFEIERADISAWLTTPASD
jgi:hypothetical protein